MTKEERRRIHCPGWRIYLHGFRVIRGQGDGVWETTATNSGGGGDSEEGNGAVESRGGGGKDRHWRSQENLGILHAKSGVWRRNSHYN
ncbi:hypothetical protein VNO77_02742 [Canavalia gladiata]|uniref:Uncharacterized protein n=1 Tax=Canavalia gladiata TaxID=3824 RepID=A0AAN9MYI7_CANGL